jgi:hypothetical protein
MTMDRKAVETMRRSLKAVSPFYPGFNNEAMQKSIDELCDMAVKSIQSGCDCEVFQTCEKCR